MAHSGQAYMFNGFCEVQLQSALHPIYKNNRSQPN